MATQKHAYNELNDRNEATEKHIRRVVENLKDFWNNSAKVNKLHCQSTDTEDAQKARTCLGSIQTGSHPRLEELVEFQLTLVQHLIAHARRAELIKAQAALSADFDDLWRKCGFAEYDE